MLEEEEIRAGMPVSPKRRELLTSSFCVASLLSQLDGTSTGTLFCAKILVLKSPFHTEIYDSLIATVTET